MPELEFINLVAVLLVAFLAPLGLGLVPGVRMPSVVLEIVAGIVLGPSVLGWVEADVPVEVLAWIGLTFMLFLAGLGTDLEHLRGPTGILAGKGFLLSIALALATAFMLDLAGLIETPILIAIALTATSIGVVIPVLMDAGEAESPFGQAVISGSTVCGVGAVLALSLLFSEESASWGVRLGLLGAFAAVLVVTALLIDEAERAPRVREALVRLQDSTAQIRIRGAFLLMIAVVAVAGQVGVELLIAGFLAGVLLGVVDRDQVLTHPDFHAKLTAVGFGVFIPVFFVASGLRLDLRALVERPATVAQVPVFLLALLVVRGLPALLYLRPFGPRRTVAAALLQATTLPFIVVATQIGVELDRLDTATAAAMVMAGLISVLIFPMAAASVLAVAAVAPDATTVPPVAEGAISKTPG